MGKTSVIRIISSLLLLFIVVNASTPAYAIDTTTLTNLSAICPPCQTAVTAVAVVKTIVDVFNWLFPSKKSSPPPLTGIPITGWDAVAALQGAGADLGSNARAVIIPGYGIYDEEYLRGLGWHQDARGVWHQGSGRPIERQGSGNIYIWEWDLKVRGPRPHLVGSPNIVTIEGVARLYPARINAAGEFYADHTMLIDEVTTFTIEVPDPSSPVTIHGNRMTVNDTRPSCRIEQPILIHAYSTASKISGTNVAVYVYTAQTMTSSTGPGSAGSPCQPILSSLEGYRAKTFSSETGPGRGNQGLDLAPSSPSQPHGDELNLGTNEGILVRPEQVGRGPQSPEDLLDSIGRPRRGNTSSPSGASRVGGGGAGGGISASSISDALDRMDNYAKANLSGDDQQAVRDFIQEQRRSLSNANLNQQYEMILVMKSVDEAMKDPTNRGRLREQIAGIVDTRSYLPGDVIGLLSSPQWSGASQQEIQTLIETFLKEIG